MKHQLSKDLSELVKSFETCVSENTHLNLENLMWREKFILEKLRKKNMENCYWIIDFFMNIPPEKMIKKTPGQWFEEAIKDFILPED